jgi:DNA primase
VPYRIDRDELLARVELADVLDALTQRGGQHPGKRAWRCVDPDHSDEHPSVKISTDSRGVQRWRCWSGGHSGTAIDAVMLANSMTVGDAIRWLNDNHAHLQPVERTPPPPPRPLGKPHIEVRRYVERAQRLLWTAPAANIRQHLHQRGLGDEILRANRIGADLGRRYLPRPRGFPAGWPAAVYPSLDRTGHVTYFQARFIEPPVGRDKYDNPARRWAANPRMAWLTPPASAVARDGAVVVTEGVPDGLVAAQAGFMSVAVLGSQHPDQRVADALAETNSAVLICFDGDDAGKRGADRLEHHLAEREVDKVTRIEPPAGLDLTDWACHDPTWMEHFAAHVPPTVDGAQRTEQGMLDRSLDFGLGLSFGR